MQRIDRWVQINRLLYHFLLLFEAKENPGSAFSETT
jgi:hypothetical protein